MGYREDLNRLTTAQWIGVLFLIPPVFVVLACCIVAMISLVFVLVVNPWIDPHAGIFAKVLSVLVGCFLIGLPLVLTEAKDD